MSPKDEHLGRSELTPRGYTLLVPPDWGRFVVDDAGRDQLVGMLRSRLLEAHRPELFGHARAAVRERWDQLRQRGAIEIYMPIVPPVEGGTPMSIMTIPWIAQGPWEDDVQRRAGGVDVETIELGDGFPVSRWETAREGRGPIEGVFAREISYVRPFPGNPPQRGIQLVASIVHPGSVEAAPALDGFTALADAVVSTLVWRFP